MKTIQDTHYKDRNPQTTVANIKKILADLGVETEELWVKESEIGTYSLRVVVKGTGNGTNGKGVTRDYALASAYAEFLERLQNGMLTLSFKFMNDPAYASEYFRAADEKILTTRELIEQDDAFLRHFFEMIGGSHLSVEDKIARLDEIEHTDFLCHGKEHSHVCLPFCELDSGRTVYLPVFLYERIYTSNGMASGNTPEEAIVQGLAEIIERYVQTRLFEEKPSLPDVPDEYIEKFPYVHEIYSRLKALPGYKVMMKDCSFGGKYPVAGLIVINMNAGTYGVKLGCHPDFGVAMERTLTETTQGCDVETYSTRSTLDFYNEGVEDWINVYNTFKVGMGQYPFELLSKKTTYDFTPMEDVSNLSNQELMEKMLDQIAEEGYEVLIRDVSNLGFPSYHIIVPGFSEIAKPSEELIAAYHERTVTSYLLTKPEMITPQSAAVVKSALAKFNNSVMQNHIRSLYPDVDWNLELPYYKHEQYDGTYLYLQVLCDVLLGDFDSAEQEMKGVMDMIDEGDPNKKISVGEFHYISGFKAIRDHDKTINFLRKFFSEEICEILEDKYGNLQELITKQFPGRDVLEEHMGPFTAKRDLEKKLFRAQKENPIAQENFAEKLEYVPASKETVRQKIAVGME